MNRRDVEAQSGDRTRRRGGAEKRKKVCANKPARKSKSLRASVPLRFKNDSPHLRVSAFQINTVRIEKGARKQRRDFVAVEEPLEIRIGGQVIAVVMRTPGEDRELAAGFLLSEGVLKKRADILDITRCTSGEPASRGNIVDVVLSPRVVVDFEKLTRHVITSSSCGVCGTTAIDAVRRRFRRISDPTRVAASVLRQLPARLFAAQETFRQTGGLHACALFAPEGKLIAAREDVGRHNALDKLIGAAFFKNNLPLKKQVLLLSGRVSFEMMQKALAAGIAIVAAIGAPSSAAVAFARASGQTLAGFLRADGVNLYAGAQRVMR